MVRIDAMAKDGDGNDWVQVERSMLSRMLYANPVCLLSVQGSDGEKNVMTITWLTPINNQASHGGFVCSINAKRHTAKFMRTVGGVFVLNVPVRGMEELVLSIGGCSGANVDKFESIPLSTCAVGHVNLNDPTGVGDVDESAKSRKKQKLSNKELAKLAIQDAMRGCIAIQGCVAHNLCRIESVDEVDGHLLLRCQQLESWCRKDYWDGRTFVPQTVDSAPFLTFLSTKRFGYVLAGDPAPNSA
ncbi:TPA: hypothetical protein N0F65_002559 [Lagenidium giganteum]|uniref:Flavin reductase like domain-containing protein n=1 Tax=Lagenidium giganteum TaxID=4803 RepID=A0AAV2YM55_9STRA|nr:TPA: hypothetical protein N0F65_002559 [Lagenidium giganteum]